jgi:UDP-glucose 4-epimerase
VRVGVTGGSGFIGSHVVDKLVDAGCCVVVVDRTAPHRADVEHCDADVLDVDAMASAFAGCDTVFHLAAVADVNIANADPTGAWELNVTGTARVWEAARRAGVRRTVLASTVWVYGGAVGEAPLTEDVPFALGELEHVYTASKVSAEMVAHSAKSLYDQEFTILRYGIPYGPRMRPALVIPRFVEAALAGERLTINGDGSQYRNYVYVEDLADAHVMAMRSDAAANATFNLEGPDPISLRRMVEGISAVLGPVEVSYGESRPGDYEGRPVSAAGALAAFGWQPRVTFEDGLKAYIDWRLATGPNNAPAPAPVAAAAAAPVEATGAAASLEDRRRRIGDRVAAAPYRTRDVVVTGALLALVAIPLLLGPVTASVFSRVGLIASVGLGGAFTWLAGRRMPQPAPSILGASAAAAVVWLLSQTADPLPVSLLAVVLGAALAMLLPDAPPLRPMTLAVAGATTLLFLALAAAHMNHSQAWLGVGIAGAVGVDTALDRRGLRRHASRIAVGFGTLTAALTVLLGGWIGATSASASWFGAQISHGPRTQPRVALTFDDVTSPAELAAITGVLDRYGVKATFFVGPGVASSGRDMLSKLVADGHTIGDNAYENKMGWLHPGYPDAAKSQRAFQRGVGFCPAYYRVPGNWHTPLTTLAVHRHGMRLVGSDVALGDHAPLDAAVRAVDKARPGSIIAVHVGESGGDAIPLPRVLPLIIDVLHAKGLQPVALHDLLDATPYAKTC